MRVREGGAVGGVHASGLMDRAAETSRGGAGGGREGEGGGVTEAK